MKIGIWSDHRQARRGRVDLVLLVELHQLLVLALLVVLPLLLDAFISGACAWRFCIEWICLTLIGTSSDPDEDHERDDRPGPRQPDGVVEPREQVREEVLERGEDARRAAIMRDAPRHAAGTASGRRVVDATVAPRVAAQEPPAARMAPRSRPNSRNASSAYCEQDGWYLHVPAGVSSPSVRRQRWTATIPIRLMRRSLCRSPREPARPASRGRASPPALRPRAGRRARSRGRAGRRPPSSRQISRSWRFTRLRVDCRADRPRHGEPEPRLAVGSSSRDEPVHASGRAWRPTGPAGRRRRSPASGTGGDRRSTGGRSSFRRRGACGPCRAGA